MIMKWKYQCTREQLRKNRMKIVNNGDFEISGAINTRSA
jgi:hypothetical protein